MLKAVAAAAVLLASVSALADEPQPEPTADPRIALPLIESLQAQVKFQVAVIKAMRQDADAQKATLWQWLVEAKAPMKPADKPPAK